MDLPADTPRLFRMTLLVSDLKRAAEFYGQLLGIGGQQVSPNRYYFDCRGTILALVEPPDKKVLRQPDSPLRSMYFAVHDIEAVHRRARQADCRRLDQRIEVQHWGERAFFVEDPFGNHLAFIDEATLFVGR